MCCFPKNVDYIVYSFLYSHNFHGIALGYLACEDNILVELLAVYIWLCLNVQLQTIPTGSNRTSFFSVAKGCMSYQATLLFQFSPYRMRLGDCDYL